MMNMTQALSDISRTNQLRMTENPKQIAEKLYQYLFKMDKGIESFSANDLDLSQYEESSLDFYQKRHRAIKYEIKKRFDAYGKDCEYSDIRYFLSYFEGKNYVFFLSHNKTHSGWKQLFCEDRSNRERILNLIFKVHLLVEGLSVETINGFEELLLIHYFDKEVDFWDTKEVLDNLLKIGFFNTEHGRKVIGVAKQIYDSRNWTAHKNPKKPPPAKISPKMAYDTLNEIVETLLQHYP